jgi:AraC-like DNA-binding protein/mannose-6-phosphate isomerase-like protein (cupin superfamily)
MSKDISFFVHSVHPDPHAINAAMERGESSCHYRLEYANHLWADSSWQFAPRSLSVFHTVFCCEGRARYDIDGDTIDLLAGSLLLVGPGVSHAGSIAGDSRPHLVTARFVQEPTRHQEHATAGLASIDGPLWWAMTVQSIQRYEGFYISMARSWHRRDEPLLAASAEMLLNVILYESITELTRDAMGDPMVGETVRYIDEHPATTLSVSDLAQRAGISLRSFSQRFRKATNKSPAQYRILRRAQAACKLLIESDLSMKEIAATLNYPDQFSFCRQFKSLYGLSPSRFRKKRLGGRDDTTT